MGAGGKGGTFLSSELPSAADELLGLHRAERRNPNLFKKPSAGRCWAVSGSAGTGEAVLPDRRHPEDTAFRALCSGHGPAGKSAFTLGRVAGGRPWRGWKSRSVVNTKMPGKHIRRNMCSSAI